MSNLFYDNLLSLKKLEDAISRLELSHAEKQELWEIIDDIIHHQVLQVIFENLENDYHEQFLTLYHQSPSSPKVLTFILEKGGEDLKGKLKNRAADLTIELLEIL